MNASPQQKNQIASAALCLSVALASLSAWPASADGPPPAFSPPRVFGRLHAIMMEGKSDPQVTLSALPRRNLYAVGALSGLRGEVAIIGGTVWLSYGRPGGEVTVEAGATGDERATLLVASNVARWTRVRLKRDVPFEGLDATVEALARAAGLDTSKPFPLMIEGPLADGKWHVLDGSARGPVRHHSPAEHEKMAVTRRFQTADGKLVGFFSKAHQGVFTHVGSNTHLHVVLPAERLMGHVDSVRLKAGATVLLPR